VDLFERVRMKERWAYCKGLEVRKARFEGNV
jgi:hypothetical protein